GVGDPLDPHRGRSRSWSDRRVKSFVATERKNRRAQRHSPDERAAFEEQLQLAQRQAQGLRAVVTPQAGEAAAFETLGVDAQPGAVPEKNLRSLARTVGEDKEIARERIAAQTLGDESGEAIEALPE